ncbi:MAG: hypothetical protein QME55_08700 [Brevundimonas sp.]|nr:hypothetical protein [Brevundimonas sp.]MDI6624797.1 hypothetical protein [Brevundimonas sp.]MDQ7811228.1 hypothetical protein [Brevundimonas sp.]
MEEVHHTHKQTTGGWIHALETWRMSRTRRRIHGPKRVVTPWGRVRGTSY